MDRKLIDYYRARAPEYEQIYYRDVPERRQELDCLATQLGELVRDKDVLDLACGTGYWAQVMSRTAQFVLAADISPEMLTEARRKEYYSQVEFVRADLYRPPVRVQSFDVVVLGFWFSHEPRQHYLEFFDIMCQPLRPGGLIWMVDNNPPAEGINQNLVRTDAFGNTFKRRFLDNGKEHVILKNYFTAEQLRTTLSQHFAIRELTYRTYYWSALLVLPERPHEDVLPPQ
ncbi:MAG TPA: class I SAM-dependent methyltransferase [Candidatus Deferrimicrobium sp.]|nr:class I SAM-dependent methyltransferase [Candidatus Deferrimicrobium sp.]